VVEGGGGGGGRRRRREEARFGFFFFRFRFCVFFRVREGLLFSFFLPLFVIRNSFFLSPFVYIAFEQSNRGRRKRGEEIRRR